MEKQWFLTSAGFLAVVLIVGSFWYTTTKVSAPNTQTSSSTTTTSATVPIASLTMTPPPSISPTPQPVVSKFPINPSDSITSWSFKSVYTGNDTLIAKTNADMEHLQSLIGKGKYDDYDLYVGIGNDYNYLGDGASAYQNYNHAVSIHPDKGLAYMNLGQLMDQLGAYYTAADAYAKAVAVEPISQYKNAQLDYMNWRFPGGILLPTVK